MDLTTPRNIPPDDELHVWTNEIENLLAEFGEVSLCYQYLHSFSQRKYKKKYHHVGNFAVDSYIPKDFQHGFTAVVGGFNIFCGILGTLLAFLKYAELYEAHRISALAWAKLSRNIEIELALHKDRRKPCRDFLKVCRSEYDNLLESSPSIDTDIINAFNKKFEGKYPDIRKPVIVNGLREIKPFKEEENDKIAKKETIITFEEEPEQEPEP
jgi:hypothetical protein